MHEHKDRPEKWLPDTYREVEAAEVTIGKSGVRARMLSPGIGFFVAGASGAIASSTLGNPWWLTASLLVSGVALAVIRLNADGEKR